MARLFSKAQRKAIHERAGGRCEGEGSVYGLPEGVRCPNALGSTWVADHDIPYACGGETELHNAKGLCVSCNVFKTGKGDIPRIAKNVRVREKATGIRRTSRPMPGSRASGWKFKMDGTRERR